MNKPHLRVTLLHVLAALVLVTGCTHQPKRIETPESANQMTWEDSQMTWQPSPSDTPARPAMIWEAAGSFGRADRKPADVTAIVFHTTEGTYDESLPFATNQARNYRNVIRYFQKNDRSVSSHFVIGPDGEICQMVRERDVAHTQTYYNDRAIGIECAGWSGRPETWTPELMESLVNLTANLCVEWDISPDHPRGTAYEGPNRVTLSNGDQRFTGEGLVGHFQVQPWNKTDPGPHFPWEEFSQRVRERIRTSGR